MLILVVLILFSFLIYKRHQQMSIIDRLGIPGPRPNFIFGNTIDIFRDGFVGVFPKWTKQYGPIVGFYIGGLPQVLISDTEMIRRVMIRDFQFFPNKNQYIPGGIHPQPELRKMLVWQKGNDWKHLRASLSPSFSSSKLNAMKPLMMESINNMLNELDNKAKLGQEFDIAPIASAMGFSSTNKCIFGINVSLNQTSKVATCLKQIVRPRLDKSFLAMAMILFPSLTFIIYPLRVWWETIRLRMLWSPEGVIYDLARKIVEARRNSNLIANDLLQLLMDTNQIESTTEMDLEMTSKDSVTEQNSSSKDRTSEKLPEEVILSNALLFLLAGTETVTTTLQFIIHNLVNHQDVQEMLRNDLKIAIGQNGGEVNFEVLSKLPLLNNIIKETLRMFPLASPFTARVAETNYECDGIRIPKGTGVFIGVYALHNNPHFWPEPEKFKPERFEGEFDKMAYLPFGAGPRNCIGMRFAMMQLQLVLANIVLTYRFESGPSTEKVITTIETFATLTTKNGVFCKVVRLE